MTKLATASIYDERYQGDYRDALSGFEFARWKALKHFLTHVEKLSDATRVLDYGAGSGLYTELWEEAFPSADLFFCDISTVAMAKFQAKYPQHADHFGLITDNRAEFDNASFDVILSVEVMEHVDELDAYLKDIHRLLRPGGRFIWTTPCGNLFSIEHIFNVLTKRIEHTEEGYRRWTWEDPTHLRRLKTSEIEKRASSCGFSNFRFRLRSHFFSFVCTFAPIPGFDRQKNWLMTLDYSLFRHLPNGASMIGSAGKMPEV